MKIIAYVWTEGGHYIGMVIFALIGGISSYLGKLQRNEVKGKFLPFVTDVLASGFAGVLAALLATSMGLSTGMTYFCVGLAGHLGARAIFLMQLAVAKKFNLDAELKDKK